MSGLDRFRVGVFIVLKLSLVFAGAAGFGDPILKIPRLGQFFQDGVSRSFQCQPRLIERCKSRFEGIGRLESGQGFGVGVLDVCLGGLELSLGGEKLLAVGGLLFLYGGEIARRRGKLGSGIELAAEGIQCVAGVGLRIGDFGDPLPGGVDIGPVAIHRILGRAERT